MISRRGDERGVVFPLVAIFLVVIIAAATLGIDISNVVRENSELQKLADIAALDAARALSSSSVTPAAVCNAAINAVEGRNGFSVPSGQCAGPELTIVLGSWGSATANGPNTFTPGGSPPNAVQATVTRNIPYFFSAGSQTDSRSAIAFATPMADVEASSYAAAVQSPLFCSLQLPAVSVLCTNLMVAGGGGFLTQSVTLGDLLGTPTAISLGILTPNAVLTASVSSVVQMTAEFLAPGQTGAAQALNALGVALGPLTASATAGSLIASASTGSSTSGANTSIEVGTLVYGGLQLANGSGINVGPIGVAGGVVSASVTGTVGQGPVIIQDAIVGSPGVTSTQIGATATLSVAGVSLTLSFGGAQSTANLVGIACTNALLTSTDVLNGTDNALTVSATAAGSTTTLPPVVTASPSPQTFTFYPDDPNNNMGQNPNPATMTTSPVDTGQAIVASIAALVPGGVPAGFPPAEVATLLDDLLTGLGFQLAGADIGSPQGGLDCGNSILVQ